MKTLLTILFFISLSSFGQTPKKVSEQITYVDGGRFKGVIFSADYELPLFDETLKGRFTPTVDEVKRLEKELKARIKEINKSRSNQGRHYGPIVDKKLGRYIRQYVGFINDKGEKVIYVGLHWNRRDYNWKEEFLIVFDGGSYHWTIRYNEDKNGFSHFGVNGIACVPNGSQQKVYAIAGCGVKFKCMSQIQFGHGGQFRSRSVLAFRCASLLRPPKPATA